MSVATLRGSSGWHTQYFLTGRMIDVAADAHCERDREVTLQS